MSLRKKDKIIGYTIGIINQCDRVVVTIELLDDTIHNMDRPLLIDKHNARYFCNKIKTLEIEDIDGKKYKEAESFLYIANKVIHKVGEISNQGDIPYYLNKDRVLKYRLYKPINGIYETYSDNGSLTTRCIFKNKKYDGLYEMYYIDGSKLYEINYKDGILDGLYKRYFINGIIEYEGTYKNGEKHGNFTKKDRDDKILIKSKYNNGILDGEYKEWFTSGQIKRDFLFNNGDILDQKTYNLFGELTEEEINESDYEDYENYTTNDNNHK